MKPYQDILSQNLKRLAEHDLLTVPAIMEEENSPAQEEAVEVAAESPEDDERSTEKGFRGAFVDVHAEIDSCLVLVNTALKRSHDSAMTMILGQLRERLNKLSFLASPAIRP